MYYMPAEHPCTKHADESNMLESRSYRPTDRATNTPFSQTYPSVDMPPLALGSCFFTASFTRGVCLVPELATPQAF